MYKYRISKTIEDEVIANTQYEAFLKARERMSQGYYNIEREDVVFVEEVAEGTYPTTPE